MIIISFSRRIRDSSSSRASSPIRPWEVHKDSLIAWISWLVRRSDPPKRFQNSILHPWIRPHEEDCLSRRRKPLEHRDRWHQPFRKRRTYLLLHWSRPWMQTHKSHHEFPEDPSFDVRKDPSEKKRLQNAKLTGSCAPNWLHGKVRTSKPLPWNSSCSWESCV